MNRRPPECFPLKNNQAIKRHDKRGYLPIQEITSSFFASYSPFNHPADIGRQNRVVRKAVCALPLRRYKQEI